MKKYATKEKKEETRRISLPATVSQHELIDRAAALDIRGKNDFILHAAIERAKEVLRAHGELCSK